MKMNFDIVKRCYEKRYNTQKYEDSVFHKSFGVLLGDIVQEAKKEVFDDLDKTDIWKYAGSNYSKIKQRHLSTFPEEKEHNSSSKKDCFNKNCLIHQETNTCLAHNENTCKDRTCKDRISSPS